uniref:Uncharacterized protein n=1 Tax=viral metagenome TaxID=1070528 RepID=A0A6C0DU69_9ZZZZ
MNNNYNIPDYIPGGAMVGVILVLILLAILVYVKPSYFKFLFKSFLGNLIVAFIVIVITIMDIKWGIGVAAVAVIVYQAFQISCVEVEGFKSSTCKPGCTAPTEPAGNCVVSKDKKTLLCPWECTTDPNNYQFNPDGSTINCIYSSECTSCGSPVKFDNSVVPSTACFSSEFGCCSDGDTSKADSSGSNCPADEESDSACSMSKYGCCPDGKTIAIDTEGSNCSNSGSNSGSYPWDNSDSKYKDSNKKPSGVSSVRGLFPEGYPVPKVFIWPENIIADFIKFQKTHNPNLRFDLNIIQKQANVQEVQELLKNNKWPWSSAVQEMYKRAIQENNIINTEPGVSMNNAQTVYNQTAILELLSWNSKEGSFLINGAIIGHNEDMPENINNLVRCGTSNSGRDISMYKIEYTGYNGIYGNMNSKVTPVNNSDLPSIVNGFKFLGSECNPCVALNNPADYSCHFSLNTGNGAEVSSVWQKLWGVNAQGLPAPNSDNKSKLKPDSVISTFNKKEFPILNQLKDEIMRGASLVDVSFKKPPTADSVSDAKISSVTGSSVPAILSNDSNVQNDIYYGTKNSF